MDLLGLFYPAGGACSAMDNADAASAFGLGSQGSGFALMSVPVLAQVGYTETYDNDRVNGVLIGGTLACPPTPPTLARPRS